MATSSEIVLEKNIQSVRDLRQEIARLKDILVTTKEGTQEWADTSEKLRSAQIKLDNINKAAKGTFDAFNKSSKDSINSLKERIKLLNQERNQMDMNSQEYKNATKELKVLNDKLRESGTSAGDWKANVGNYANSLSGSFAQLGSAASGLSTGMGVLNTSMLKVATNPIGGVVVALSAAIGALAKGISSSEENTNKWNKVLAPLKGLMEVLTRYIQEAADKFITWIQSMKTGEGTFNAFEKVLQAIITAINVSITRVQNMVSAWGEAFDKLKTYASNIADLFTPITDGIGNVITSIKNGLQPAIDWVIEKYNSLANSKFGKMLGLVSVDDLKNAWDKAGESVEEFTDDLNKAAAAQDKLAQMQANLNKAIRARNEANAKDGGILAELENQIALAREQKDYAKVLELINEKKEVAARIAARNVATAKDELAIIQLQNKQSGSSTEALNAESAARVKVTEAVNAQTQADTQLINEERKIKQLMDSDAKAKKAQELADAVKNLNGELKNYEAQYTAAIALQDNLKSPEGNEISKDSLNAFYDAQKAQYEADLAAYNTMIDGKIQALQEFIDLQKSLGNETALQEAEIEKLQASRLAKTKEINKKIDKNETDRVKSQKALYKTQLSAYSGLMDAVSGLFEENTIAYKATATAKALIDTYLAAQNALAEVPYPANFVAMAAAIASGIANVVSILKVNPKGESSASASAPSVSAPNIIDSEPYTYARTLQTNEEEEEINKPIFVNVVDIEDKMESRKVRVTESTF